MIVDETVSYLEMTSRDQLIPGRAPQQHFEMRRMSAGEWRQLAETFIRIGDFVGKGFQTRRIPPWTEAQWRERLTTAGVVAHLAYVGDEVAGYFETESQPDGNVEIAVFGLVPEFIGKGIGGHALTIGVEAAWKAEPIDGVDIQRVWLHTSTRDHPAALPNYERRGFQVFRTEQRQREVSLRYDPPSIA